MLIVHKEGYHMIYTRIQGCVQVQSYRRCQQSEPESPLNRPRDELLNLGCNVFCMHVFADVV